MRSPLIPMSAIVGKPSKTEIESYLQNLKKNGIDQLMLYPRSGCALAYLSEEWFQTIEHFISGAKKFDLYLWLYDEFNWPSGDAGGRVSAISEYRLKSIVVKGPEIGKISTRSLHNTGLFAEKFFPDLLSEKAVAYFIRCTHEAYYQRFGSEFGKRILGIFTDEPSIAYCCTDTSIPYYEEMGEDYARRFGRDFWKDLKDGHPSFYRNSYELLGDKLHASYVMQIRQWCDAHHLLMTGHFHTHGTPMASVKSTGRLLRNLSGFSLPGCDDVETYLARPTHFGMVEYAAKEHGGMAELFALGPCDMPYAKKRVQLFYAACFKINHYFLAISHMDLRGNRLITEYFNDFNVDQPDFAGTRLLAEEAKIAASYAEKDFVPDVYIRFPESVCSAHVLDDFRDEAFTKIIDRFTIAQISWKYASETDDCAQVPVLSFDETMRYVLNDTCTSDPARICEMLHPVPLVTDADGNPAKGVFVRKFTDGSFLVLNRSQNPLCCKIDGEPHTLDGYGVYRSDRPQTAWQTNERLALTQTFRPVYHNPNILRAMYVKQQTDFSLCANFDCAVTFAVRKEDDVALDGKTLPTTEKADSLCAGMRPFYAASDTILLSKGDHCLTTHGKDLRFFPTIFVIGNFACEAQSAPLCAMTLTKRKEIYTPGEPLHDFGKISFVTECVVPQNAVAVELLGTSLFTTVQLAGIALGEAICPPYIFPLPTTVRGKRGELTVTQYSSLGPIFGDTDYFERVKEHDVWTGGFIPPNGTTFGFAQIRWILE